MVSMQHNPLYMQVELCGVWCKAFPVYTYHSREVDGHLSIDGSIYVLCSSAVLLQ